MSSSEENKEVQESNPEIEAMKDGIKKARKELSACQKRLHNELIRYGKLLASSSSTNGKRERPKEKKTKEKKENKGEGGEAFVCGGNPFSDPPTPCPGTDMTKGASTRLDNGKYIEQCASCKKAVTNTRRKAAKKKAKTSASPPEKDKEEEEAEEQEVDEE